MIFKNVYIQLSAAFILGCTFLLACENSKQDIDNLAKKKLGVEEAVTVNINYTLAGKAKAVLVSPLMLRVQSDTMPYIEFPKKIHVDFYNDSTKIESILDAKYARYIESQSKILLKDSVRFIGLKNGDTLYCDELYWDRNRPTYQFYTDKPVRIRTKMQIINGTGFETSQDFKDKHVMNPTNTIIRVPASQFPEY
ncbi:LPS export ABC transporter periplasmic protein LptC [Ferruginibacter sp.]|nr:LPS export ABC transporter periplasmic protein LptC [Ferruginibacter sp.]